MKGLFFNLHAHDEVMISGLNKRLYLKASKKGISVAHACEVGVYKPEMSNILDYIVGGTRVTLVEPEPESVQAIEAYTEAYDHVRLHPVAIYDRKGTLKLSNAAASTFVSELPSSPALVNDKYEKRAQQQVEVPCCLFSDIDPGDIDLLSIDTEGSDWYVLLTLKSSPQVISIETHGKFYTNPFIGKIKAWFSDHGYVLWYMDKSDSVYVKKGSVRFSVYERLSLVMTKAYIGLRKQKKALYNLLGKG